MDRDNNKNHKKLYSMDEILNEIEYQEYLDDIETYYDELSMCISYYIDKLIENGIEDTNTILKLVYLEFYQ